MSASPPGSWGRAVTFVAARLGLAARSSVATIWFDGVPWCGGVDGVPWRDGASWRGPLALSRDQMRAESLLCLELERGEPGFLDERA